MIHVIVLYIHIYYWLYKFISMDDRFITWTYIWNMYVKLNIFYLCISQYPIIELGNNWLMGKNNFSWTQAGGWVENKFLESSMKAWGENNLFSEGTPRGKKLRIQLYLAKVTSPGLKQGAGWKRNSWTQARRIEGNYERVCDINGKT